MIDIKPAKVEYPIIQELVPFMANWPTAVSYPQLCEQDSKEKKSHRAFQILDCLVTSPMRGKKFLDFGCGEGYTLQEARRCGAKFAIGYDIDSEFRNGEDVFDDINVIKENSPYDIILIYDVLDHTEASLEILQILHNFCHQETDIYVTVHPWVSRHGSHEFHTVNKAFVHLFRETVARRDFTDYGYYKNIFLKSGFSVVGSNVRKDLVENFFLSPPFMKYLEKIASSVNVPFPMFVWKMRNSFLDFKLRVNTASAISSYSNITFSYPVATLLHTVEEERFQYTLLSNNKVNDPIGMAEWVLKGQELTLTFPNLEAPDGMWIDTLYLNSDMQTYSGTNQLGAIITGHLI